MALLFRLFIGFAIVAVGIVMVLRTWWVVGFMGTSSWAEEKFGPGGTNLFYKLFGIVIALLGFVVMTNLWNALLGATLGSLFRR